MHLINLDPLPMHWVMQEFINEWIFEAEADWQHVHTYALCVLFGVPGIADYPSQFKTLDQVHWFRSLALGDGRLGQVVL